MNAHEMMEEVIKSYQEELYQVYLIVKNWDTDEARELATQISASLPFRGKLAIVSKIKELEKTNRELQALLVTIRMSSPD